LKRRGGSSAEGPGKASDLARQEKKKNNYVKRYIGDVFGPGGKGSRAFISGKQPKFDSAANLRTKRIHRSKPKSVRWGGGEKF